MNILDRLLKAEEEAKGLRLSPTEVADLVEEISEMELQREIDAIMAAKVIAQLTGEPARGIH